MSNADLLGYSHIPPAEPNISRDRSGGLAYTLRALRYSHWTLDGNGEMSFPAPGKISVGDGWYAQDKVLSTTDTAFVVMDPWRDMADDFLNRYCSEIEHRYNLPMIDAAADAGHRIIVLTNPPNPYNHLVSERYYELERAGRAQVLQHSDYTPETFSKMLCDGGIKKLVYTGYFSNMCVPFRPLGLSRMAQERKFELFFVPECSAAMEHRDTWETQLVHRAASFIISQTQALILRFGDIMNALK